MTKNKFSLQTRAYKTSKVNQVTHILTGDKLDYGLEYGQVLSTSMDKLMKNRVFKMLPKSSQKTNF